MPRNKKYWKRRFGNKTAGDTAVYQHHLDFRRIDDLDDEGFAYIMTGVKGVNMLELNETEMSNKSIELLTCLEYVKELRLKGCHQLDDGCIESMDKLATLEFLHVKNTGITIDGLLKLTNLLHLKELMFSADDENNIKEKMEQLKDRLPGCAFTVNGSRWSFERED